eukprot:CAMPEP_0115060200 /NCGR_PEP_ID=MMETSP0227-20121206/7339_1 /TAXON_ID=89957 /ORGANISM="Polarella glacialis, Strain CCMP 1383" /LENGTH=397 /DNA_ID=CAMNT_0002445403 /DNA_START=106 /DNA_END=1299 /DNA_ORIENTATION=+
MVLLVSVLGLMPAFLWFLSPGGGVQASTQVRLDACGMDGQVGRGCQLLANQHPSLIQVHARKTFAEPTQKNLPVKENLDMEENPIVSVVDQFKAQEQAEEEEEKGRETSLGPQEKVREIHRGKARRFHSYYDWWVSHYSWLWGLEEAQNDKEILERKSKWPDFLQASAAAFATFTINLMDVIWIIPFVRSKEDGKQNALIYIALSQLIAVISILVVCFRGTVMKEFPSYNMELIFNIVTSILLTLFAAYLFKEAAEKVAAPAAGEAAPAPAEEEAAAPAAEEVAAPGAEEAAPAKDHITNSSPSIAEPKTGRSSGQFLILVLLGSLDQIAVYVPLLATGELTAVELSLGVLVSGVLALALCSVLGHASRLVDFIEALPMWAIVAALAFWSYAVLLGV